MIKITFVQLPLVTKEKLEPEEDLYYTNYWKTFERIFKTSFPRNEIYTIPEFPLWVTYLNKSINEAGFQTDFIDLAKYTGPFSQLLFDKILIDLQDKPSSYYLFSPFTNNFSLCVKIVQLIRTVINPNAKMIIGGAHATALPSVCIQAGFDYVITGKGETNLSKLLRTLQINGNVKGSVENLWYKTTEGVLNTVLSVDKTYSQFNSVPDYTVIPETYKVHFGRVYSSIGCPYKCSFCADTNWIGIKPFYKDVKIVMREIRMIRHRYNVNIFLFGDEVFTLNKKYVKDLCAELKSEQIQWFCQTRANLIDPELMSTLYNSGCKLIQIGAESSDQAVLENLRKKTTITEIKEACMMAKEAGLAVLTYWMVGGPGETESTAQKTLVSIGDLFDKRLTDLADYYICTPYPGTDIYNYPDKYDVTILHKTFDDWREDQPSVMRTKSLNENRIFEIWKQGLALISQKMELA